MSRRILILFLLLAEGNFLLLASDATHRSNPHLFKRYWQSLIHGNVDRTYEKPFDVTFALAPTYSREGGFGIGGSVTGLYRLNRSDSTMAPSNVTVGLNASLKGFFSVVGSGVNYFADGRTRLVYNAKFSRKVLDFWGITFDACDVNPTSEYIRTQFSVDADYNYRLGGCFYFGAVLHLNYTFADKILAQTYLDGQASTYYLSGVGASFQIDTRDNPTRPERGVFLLLRETIFPHILGTDNKTICSTLFTLCGYQSLWRGGVLAEDFYARFSSEGVPWVLREKLGGVLGRMRGYYAGRYIDANQVTAQIELRQHIASRFGCVAWVGAGTVFPSLRQINVKNILPNYGVGIRVEFKHNVNLRIDFGLGKNTAGFSFGFGEAF
jgi:hypothetical protein